jgi:hypothetical protein
MEVVDVLRAKKQSVADCALQGGKRVVRCIRFASNRGRAPFRVEAPHDVRVGRPTLRGRDLLDPVLTPVPARAA